jgi:hypothetical protein
MLACVKLRLLALILLVLPLCGCAGPEISSIISVAQYGTTTFTHGSLETVTAQPFDKVTKGTRTMIEELDFTIVVDKPQGGFLYLKCTDQQGTAIMLRILQRTSKITSVKVQVGMFGDGPYSTAIMSRIADVLKRDRQTVTTPATTVQGDPAVIPPEKPPAAK